MGLLSWAVLKLGGTKNGSDFTFNIGPDFLRNLVVVVSAIVAFATWLSATIAAPVQISALKAAFEAHKLDNIVQYQKIDNKEVQLTEKIDLVYSDVRDIKNILMTNQANQRYHGNR